jgi:hypothetical protein
MSFYFDDITIGVGALVYRYISVCAPDMEAHEECVIHVDVKERKPAVKAKPEDEAPSMKGDFDGLEPSVEGETLRPSLKAFPVPEP